MEVTLKESTSEGEIIKEILHNQGRDTIRKKLGIYISLLKEGELFLYMIVSDL